MSAPEAGAALRCLVVGRDVLIRLGLQAVLESGTGVVVTNQAHSVGAALALCRITPVDVVVLDHEPGGGPLDELCGLVPVVVLSASADPDLLLGVLQDGIAGYLKHGDFDEPELLRAVQAAVQGRRSLSPAPAAAVLRLMRAAAPRSEVDHAELTTREQQVVSLLVAGSTELDIAEALGITAKTVRNHLQSVYLKYHLHSQSEVVAWWSGRLLGRAGRRLDSGPGTGHRPLPGEYAGP